MTRFIVNQQDAVSNCFVPFFLIDGLIQPQDEHYDAQSCQRSAFA